MKKKLSRKVDEQWKCRDLSYIIALLRAYGVPDRKPFHFYYLEGSQEKTTVLWCEVCCFIYVLICKDLGQWYWASDIG
uniref:Uncharacterized protein n=1 Tax=Romanomermis culicivorax TaxID=13658 RepID=A0A915KHI9_ROMCU